MTEAPALHVLQKTMFPNEGEPSALFGRISQTTGAQQMVNGGAAPGRGARAGNPRCRPVDMFDRLGLAVRGNDMAPVFSLRAGDAVSFDTYFNSFYHDYWTTCAGLDAIYVSLNLNGRIFVDICRVCGEAAPETVVRFECQADGEDIAFPIATSSRFPMHGTGRLFVRINAVSDSTIRDLAFATDQPPRREVSLTIGLCTYNRESYLSDIVTQLSRAVVDNPEIAKVFIVNQGAPFEAADLIAKLESNRKFVIINQANHGGCGGFVRSMLEALECDGATHHLLCDDDIIINPGVFGKLIAFLKYSSDEVAVGAHMLDRLKKSVIYEAGARISADNRLIKNAHNRDVADTKGVSGFNAYVGCDYNAWWFCALPLEAVRKLGLPAPVFIRGDDIEYGVRMARHGIQTISLPGIAVWHDPFYAKPIGWYIYYDIRNRLIFASKNPDICSLDRPVQILEYVVRKCVVHNYYEATLILHAVTDFLEGPDRLFSETSPALHEKLIKSVAHLRPQDVNSADCRSTGWLPVKQRRNGGMVRDGLAILSVWIRTFAGFRSETGESLICDKDAHFWNTGTSAYIRTDSMRSFHQTFKPSRWHLIRITGAAVTLYFKYKIQRTSASARWHDNISKYTTRTYWSSVLQCEDLGGT